MNRDRPLNSTTGDIAVKYFSHQFSGRSELVLVRELTRTAPLPESL